MVNIDILFNEGKISKINELELQRYVNFFENSYLDNLDHANSVIKTFPRWSIISGYYAMHDISKLLIAKKFSIKIDFEVHSTTIKVLRELINKKELFDMLETGYKEFLHLANDLEEAKKERVKTQYFTGTDFMKKEFEKKSLEFISDTVLPYIQKIKVLL